MPKPDTREIYAKVCSEYTNEHVVKIVRINEEINQLKDVDSILDKVLLEARSLANADAGSIFLVNAENDLTFSYVQNDSLMREDGDRAAIYKSFAVPISEHSIVGYAAKTRKILSTDDAYTLAPTLPYSFNKSFDEKSGYRTSSMLTIPLINQNELVGVMQLLNARTEQGKVIPFPRELELYIPLLATNASAAIERGIMNRELILRMMRMAELRDPSETGPHVQRVGAYSAEIYQHWAKKKGVNKEFLKKRRDLIRLAAMLHDVGKIGITDFILKKPGKLTKEEFNTMQWHTVYGARLFPNTKSELDVLSREIALNHHEKWIGGGYPGKVQDIWSDTPEYAEAKAQTEIPLEARICTLADVFDALTSRRSYKEPLPDDKVLSILEKDSGTHFDPEFVASFFEIFEVIKAIREKFQEDNTQQYKATIWDETQLG